MTIRSKLGLSLFVLGFAVLATTRMSYANPEAEALPRFETLLEKYSPEHFHAQRDEMLNDIVIILRQTLSELGVRPLPATSDPMGFIREAWDHITILKTKCPFSKLSFFAPSGLTRNSLIPVPYSEECPTISGKQICLNTFTGMLRWLPLGLFPMKLDVTREELLKSRAHPFSHHLTSSATRFVRHDLAHLDLMNSSAQIFSQKLGSPALNQCLQDMDQTASKDERMMLYFLLHEDLHIGSRNSDKAYRPLSEFTMEITLEEMDLDLLELLGPTLGDQRQTCTQLLKLRHYAYVSPDLQSYFSHHPDHSIFSTDNHGPANIGHIFITQCMLLFPEDQKNIEPYFTSNGYYPPIPNTVSGFFQKVIRKFDEVGLSQKFFEKLETFHQARLSVKSMLKKNPHCSQLRPR